MPRLTRDGFNTSAIFGFVNTLEELLRKEKPSHPAALVVDIATDPDGTVLEAATLNPAAIFGLSSGPSWTMGTDRRNRCFLLRFSGFRQP